MWTRSGWNDAMRPPEVPREVGRNAVRDPRALELGVERLGVAPAVEPDERRVDAGWGERGE